MKSEVKMSPNDDNPEEVKKAQKKYLWFGYGSYTNYGFSDPVNTNNMRAAPDILDKLFELFGVKEKEPEETKNYKE
jgi:hypothetical protein